MGKAFFPRLAAQGILSNRRFYFPYLLTIIGTAAGYYNIRAIAGDSGMARMPQAAYVTALAQIGVFLTAGFALLFLFYTNSFLMKRRTRELGLYNVLGMGKGHIALLLLFESLYAALIGIGGGLCAGVLLHKVATLFLHRLLGLDVPFGFEVSAPAIASTAALFLVILGLSLLHNLRQITLSSPIELLRSGNAGEREPRTKWVLAILGVLTLGGGYALALATRSSMEALAFYFVAVILVIIGTYCLFTAGSIAVLKLLRRSKRFYYKTSHFIGVSGMLYRMKQNAVGLANICILSTMVLVMLSGTLSLYLGIQDTVDRQAPSDLVVSVSYLPEEQPAGPDISALREKIQRRVEALGQSVTSMEGNYVFDFSAGGRDGRYALDYEGAARYGSLTVFTFLTAQDYAALTGRPVPELAEDEVLLFGVPDRALTFTYLGRELGSFRVRESLTDFPAVSGGGIGSVGRPAMVVVRDMDALLAIRELYGTTGMQYVVSYEFRVDITGTAEEQYDLGQRFSDLDADFSDTGEWTMLRCHSYQEIYAEAYGLAGGFLFLGVFLGLLFIMATVLIIYYKQISEGYEDRRRFEIMRQVGLEQRDIRRSVNSQILVVFFLPLLAAAVHVAFDFRLMLQLLEIFSITNVRLTALCSLGVLLVFALLYAVVYRLTARVYYRIVSR